MRNCLALRIGRTQKPLWRTGLLVACLGSVVMFSSSASGQDALETILNIDRGGGGIADASAAAEQLLKHDASLERLLAKASGANPVAKNWILGLAEAVADRQPEETTRKTLERFLADDQGDGEARYFALDYLSRGNPEMREHMLDGRTDDTSLDIRYEAIELALKKLPSADAAKDDEQTRKQAIASYRRLLQAARLPEQVNNIAGKLKELGEEVDVRSHFGFVSDWKAVGPFDNRKEVGFDTAYPPELEYLHSKKLDATRKYAGKGGDASWLPATTDKPDGKVDLNPVFNNEKGAVVYAYAVVESPEDITCQLRIGSPDANKVWVNGVEATANNVYHTGSQIDQYIGPASLKRGSNTILVKVCQNEQTEPWAQDFSFQLRFTDPTGLAVPVAQ